MADTVPGDTSSAAALVLGTATTGSVDAVGDRDWYRIDLTAGKIYTITVDGIGDYDLIDSLLTLRNSNGVSLVSNDDGGIDSDSQITFTATATGTYFVDVGGFDSSDFSLGDFSVLVVDAAAAGADSVAAYAGTTATIGAGSTTIGKIDTLGDHDWYAVSLTAGTAYYFRTAATGGANDVDTTIFVRDANGIELVENDDAQEIYSFIRFTPTTTGTYYLDVEAYSNDDTGAYKLITDVVTTYSYDQIADFLTTGYWDGHGGSRHFDVQPGGTITVNITAINSGGQLLARNALALWSDVTGIGFTEVSSGGQIVFSDNKDGASTNSKVSANVISTSTVNVSAEWLTSFGTGLNSYTFEAYIHEIGHALGLGHAGYYNGTADYDSGSLYFNDSLAASIMSYFDPVENTDISTSGFTKQYVVTPMEGDILAMRTVYGGGATATRTGDTVYGFGNTSGRASFDASLNPNVSYTIVDNGGTDTLDYGGFSAAQRINLNSETFSDVGGRVGNVMIARGTVIENAASGSGNDTIIGNDAANKLTGNGGNDTISGGSGDDMLDGGLGADIAVFSGNRSDYLVTEEGHFFRLIDQRAGANDGNDLTISVETFQFADASVLATDALSIPAGAVKIGSEFLVNTKATGDQEYPMIAGLSNGGFVVTWTTSDTAQDGSSFAIKAQLFNDIGAKVGSEFLVNTQAAGSQFYPTIAGLSNGGFVATWLTESSTQDGSGMAVKAQLFNANGAKTGSEFIVNTQVAGDQDLPSVAGLSNGGFVVSWRTSDVAQDGSGSAIKAQLFDATGTKLGGEFLVDTQGAGNQYGPRITGLSNGGFVVSWFTDDTTQDGSGYAVKAQLFDANGAKVGSEFLVNTQVQDHQMVPTITGLSNGGFVVSWQTTDYGQDGSGYAIKAQLFSATGAKVGSEFLVNTQGENTQTSPSIAGLGNGGFVISWDTVNAGPDGLGSAIRAQTFDAMGAKTGREFMVNSLDAGNQRFSTIAGLSDGDFVISWASLDTSQDGSGFAIKAQIFDAIPVPAFVEGSTQAVTTMEDVVTAISSAATITDNSALIWSIATSPAHGTLTGSAGAYSYTPAANYNGPDSFVVKVADSAGHMATQTVNLTVSAVNDAPVNSMPASYTTNEDSSFKLTGLSVADLDAASGMIAVTLAVASGALTAVSGGSVTVSGSGTGSLVLSGTLANINSYLANVGNQPTYVPVANANGTVLLTITTNDGGNSGAGGAKTDVDSININITAVNDAPVNIVPAAQSTNQDSAKVITGLSIADVDAGSGTLTVTLAVDHGKVAIGAVSGAATIAGNNSASVTITSSLTDINATLAAANAVTYTPTPNYVGADTLHVTTNDNGNSGSGGALTDTDIVGITVVAVNHAPVNNVPGAQTTNEDSFKVIAGLSIADVDAGTGALSVTLAVDHGTIALGAASGVGIIAGNNSVSVTITGSLTDINATLAAANAVTYTPTLNYGGADTLHVTTDDNGNSGSGGALTDIDTVGITVIAVNDAPVNTVPGAQTINPGVAKVITGLSVSDVDAGSGQLTVTLAVDHGSIALGPASGGAIIAGNNSASVTLTGNLAAINTTLGAANAVTYTSSPGYNGDDKLHFNTSDNGNSGSGGALVDTGNVDLLPSTSVAQVHGGESVGATGRWNVFGDSGSETITVGDHSFVTLRSGFNAGAMDNLRLTGQAADFSISASGSNAVLTSIVDDMTVSVPIGLNGIKVIFDNDVVRTIAYVSGATFDVSSPQTVAGASNVGAISSTSAIGQVHAGENIGVSGRWNIFGDSGSETITVGDHSLVTFRSGFNAGATDSIRLTGQQSNFSFSLSGSNAVLTSIVDDIMAAVPVGTNGFNALFDNGDSGTILFDGTKVIFTGNSGTFTIA